MTGLCHGLVLTAPERPSQHERSSWNKCPHQTCQQPTYLSQTQWGERPRPALNAAMLFVVVCIGSPFFGSSVATPFALT